MLSDLYDFLTPSDIKWALPILTSKHKSEYLWVISIKGVYLDIIFKIINHIRINRDNEKYYSWLKIARMCVCVGGYVPCVQASGPGLRLYCVSVGWFSLSQESPPHTWIYYSSLRIVPMAARSFHWLYFATRRLSRHTNVAHAVTSYMCRSGFQQGAQEAGTCH